MTLVYDLAYLVLALISLPSFVRRLSQARCGRELLRQRSGILPPSFKDALIGKKIIWLHAVSVGEVMAVSNFIKNLLRECPGYHLVLTTVTPTGQQVAQKFEGPQVSVCYFPFDFSFAVRSFFRDLQPECLLLAETEIWPNLIMEASRSRVPVGILNARLSSRSARRYSRFQRLFQPLFSRLDFVLAQTVEDAERFAACGTPRERVEVLGNMKYDNVVLEGAGAGISRSFRQKWGLGPDDRIWVAGSTHKGEEKILARVFVKIREKHPDLKLVIAPRHIERSAEVAAAFEKCGVEAGRVSLLSNGKKSFPVLILDQLGVLKDVYAMADAVFVGGSLIPKRGGQNPIEPAVFRKAIVHGPYVFNFERVYQVLDDEGGAMLAKDESELALALERILGSPAETERLGQRAYQAVVSLRGATEKHVRWLADFLASETELVKG